MEGEGVYLSEQTEIPLFVDPIEEPIRRLSEFNVELLILDELWDFRETIYHSSLNFSFIRMRNARPPRDRGSTYLPLP